MWNTDLIKKLLEAANGVVEVREEERQSIAQTDGDAAARHWFNPAFQAVSTAVWRFDEAGNPTDPAAVWNLLAACAGWCSDGAEFTAEHHEFREAVLALAADSARRQATAAEGRAN